MEFLLPPVGQVRRTDFERDFVFGSSTASYQVEGCALDGGRGLSLWDAYTLHTPGAIDDGSNGNVAAHNYYLFNEDVKLMKRMGLDAYRFSISWSRVLPGGRLCTGVNKDGIKFYNDLIDAVKAAGMKPYVTLFHWDLPLTLEMEYGGFLSENIVQDFCDFAEVCFWEFGDRVKHWITINEAWTYTVRGYAKGTFPPGRGSPIPRDIEQQVVASITPAKRGFFKLKDKAGNIRGDVPPNHELEEYLQNILSTASEDVVSVKEIDKFVNDLLPAMPRSDLPIRDIVEYIKDVLLGLFVDYKCTKKAETCSKGDPGREPYVVGHNFLLAHAAVVDLIISRGTLHNL